MIYRAKIEAEIYYETDTKDISEVQEEILDEVSWGLGLTDLANWDSVGVREIALMTDAEGNKIMEYIGNYKIVKALSELPKLNDKRIFRDAYCISINAYEYEDIKTEFGNDLPEEEMEKYLFYKIYYCEDRGKNMAFGVDTFHFSYCILKENI